MTASPSPFTTPPMAVEKDWIDYNGHLNMAYYNVLFDRGADAFFERLGLGPNYLTERQHTFYTAEAHVRYVRELHLGHEVRASMRIVDLDEKRIHAYAELHHTDGWLAASCETMSLHIDMSGPRVAVFPDDVFASLKQQFKHDSQLEKPHAMGQPIGIRRK
ncbi:MAG: thioesterase family protein [Pseudomonadota bacterium]